MFCTKCGKEVREGAVFCTFCGEPMKVIVEEEVQAEEISVEEDSVIEETPVEETTQEPVYAELVQTNAGKVGFGKAISLFFKNYVNFTGRSTRSEYWWAYLFTTLVSIIVSYIPVVGSLLLVFLCIPGLAISVRRLHDIGKSWTFLLMGLIPFAGAIILSVRIACLKDSSYYSYCQFL